LLQKKEYAAKIKLNGVMVLKSGGAFLKLKSGLFQQYLQFNADMQFSIAQQFTCSGTKLFLNGTANQQGEALFDLGFYAEKTQLIKNGI